MYQRNMKDKQNRIFFIEDKSKIDLQELSTIVVGGYDGIVQNDFNSQAVVKLFLGDNRDFKKHNQLKKFKQIDIEEARKIIDSWTI